MRYPLLTKLLALGAVLLSLVWGLGVVGQLVDERAGRLREAEQGVADSLASSQTVVGPALARRCVETWPVLQGEGKEAKRVTERRDFSVYAMPRKLKVNASASTQSRYRGIYKVNTFSMNADLLAEWSDLSTLEPRTGHEGGSIECDTTVLMLALGDTRGLRQVEVRLQGQPLVVAPGTLQSSHPRGLHARLPELDLSSGASGDAPLRATVHMELVGTGNLAWAPIARDNDISVASNWPHPSFGGRFLPSTRQVSAQGFSAAWQVSALATTAGDSFAAGRAVCRGGDGSSPGAAAADAPSDKASAAAACIETFGIAFVDPVNPYVLSDRAVKYGILFIGLTFVAVGLVEVMRQLRVHPIQYLLVGCALVVFFLLLLSLSETWTFAAAYSAAAAACTALLAYYGAYVLRGWKPGLVFGGGIATLFGLLYVLLQLEQGSLVLGSVLLFAVLAAVMAVTRKLDWYALMDQLRADLRPDAAKPPATAPAHGMIKP